MHTLELGDVAPDFSLIGTDGLIYTINQYRGSRAIVVFFTCNHCPYAKGSEKALSDLCKKYIPKGVVFLAINSNDATEYPEDSYDNMQRLMEEKDLPWPYLSDSSQEIAKKFGAVCTPHFFLFDHNRYLVYTGGAFDNPKKPAKSTKNPLEDAIIELLDSKPITTPSTNPLGCSIK